MEGKDWIICFLASILMGIIGYLSNNKNYEQIEDERKSQHCERLKKKWRAYKMRNQQLNNIDVVRNRL